MTSRRTFLALTLLLLCAARSFGQDPTASASLSSTTCPGSGCVAMSNLSNRQVATVEVSGSWSGALSAEITSSWTAVPVFVAGTRAQSSAISANGTYIVPMAGASSIRVHATSITGTAVVRLTAGQGDASFELAAGAATSASQATGNSSLSSIDTKQTTANLALGDIDTKLTNLVNGTQKTQITDGTNTATVKAASTAAAAVDKALVVAVSPNNAVAVTGTFWQATQPVSGTVAVSGTVPVSGTVTANAGTGTFAVSAAALPLPSGAATQATLNDVQRGVADLGSNVLDRVLVTGAFDITALGMDTLYTKETAPTGAEKGLVVRNIPSGTQAVSGTFWQATQPVSAATLPLPTGAATESTLGFVSSGISTLTATSVQDATPISDTAWRGFPVMGKNVGTSQIEIPYVRTIDPSGTDRGFVVRNIPSGTQAVSASSLPLPAGAATEATLASLNGKVTTVDTGNVTVASSALPTGASTSGNQTTANSSLSSIDTKLSNLTSGTQTTRVTDGTNTATVKAASTAAGATDKALVVAVSPNNTVGVTGTFWQTTQPVSIASMPSTPVTGTFFQATQPVSSTQLPAALAANGGLKIEGVASGVAVPISGSVSITGTPAVTVTGSVTANAGTNLNTSALALEAGHLATIDTSTARIPAQGQALAAASLPVVLTAAQLTTLTPLSSVTVSGTVTTSPPSNASANVAQINGVTPLMGAGNTGTGSQRVTIASDQVSIPVTATLAAETTKVIGTVNVAAGQSITANAGTNLNTSALALDATLTGRTQKAQITDGTRDGTVKAASTLPALTDTAVVTTQRDPLPAGTNVIGHVIADTGSTTAVTGSVTVVQPTGTNLHAVLDAGSATIGALTANQSVNQTQMNGVAVSTAQGVADTGTQRVQLAQEATYAASTAAKTATAAGTAAFFEICGSGTKTVRIQRVVISGTVATAAIYGDVQLRKVSSVGTGNTATTLTATPYDSNSAAATATAKFNTVLPTGGNTLVGNIFAQTLFFPLTGTVANFQPQLLYVWRDQDAEAPTLRGATQCLTAAFGTTPTNAPTLSVSVAWTEK